MKNLIINILVLLSNSLTPLNAQSGKIYHVPGSYLNMRAGSSTDTEIKVKLDQYSNLECIEEEGDWVKVKYEGEEGYVFNSYIKEGKAVVSTYEYRVGAVCKDGTSSSATGKGACSLTEKSVRIINYI